MKYLNILLEWRKIGTRFKKSHKNDLAKEIKKYNYDLNEIILKAKNDILKNNEAMATRKSSEKILSHLVEKNKFLIGGSADLSGSNNTKIKSHKIIKANDFKGNYIHYGVRERAMCSYEWYSIAQQSETIWRYFFDF